MAAYSIEQALAEPAPPAGGSYARALELYTTLQTHRGEWNNVVSHSHEGESYTVELGRKERIILTYYAAYKQALALADGDAATGTNPVLLAAPVGRRFDFSGGNLHSL